MLFACRKVFAGWSILLEKFTNSFIDRRVELEETVEVEAFDELYWDWKLSCTSKSLQKFGNKGNTELENCFCIISILWIFDEFTRFI